MKMCFVFLCLYNFVWSSASFSWNTTTNLSDPGVTNEPTAQVVSNDLDQAIAIWSRYNGNWFVETAYSTNDGETWFAPLTDINPGTPASDPLPRVALNDNNAAIAVYNGSIHPFYSVDGGQNWAASATPLGAGITVQEPQIVLQGENHAIACWTGAGGAIQSAYSLDAGVNWTPSTGAFSGAGAAKSQVATNIIDESCLVYELGGLIQGFYSVDGGATWTESSPLNLSGSTASAPRLVLEDTGMAVAVWKRWDVSLAHTVIESVYSTDAGATWSSSQILSNPNEDADNPQVCLNSDGDTIVVWESVSGIHTIQYVHSFDGGFSFSSPIILSFPTDNSVTPDVSINDDGVSAIVYADTAEGIILASSSVDSGVTFSSPVALSSSTGIAGKPSLVVNGQDYAIAIWAIDKSSFYTVQTIYGNFFNVFLAQGVNKLLFQRDYVNRIFCDPMPDASLYRVYSDEYLTDMLYVGTVPEFFHHGQKKGASKTYYMTWADQFGEESSSAEVTTP